MDEAFNLLDEPWLAVRMHDGQVRELGLLALFEQAGEISALAETSPPSLIAQYRLLLAITHRAISQAQGRWTDAERLRWYQDGLPLSAIRDYLQRWRERFWLFHPQYPFMQVAALADEPETQAKFPGYSIRLAQFYGSEMFNQGVYNREPEYPAPLLRDLLGYFQFVPGGFFPGKKLKSSEKAGPLVNTAAVMPLGASLAQSLCLAL
ncbi:MAG: type I-E CRISPR-associated protein Cse1/CasA, partial [Ectopseudomonas oleovorans]